ncbi:hypothetical protein B0T24DRAFT_644199 [Lasiosphaeria ovina]|uniref:Uncharacterized protein n=1 Tax=Lasiosphaeria ovina TaxID=92902 RepID=A0AAE0JRM8_9PEZI|nr:hypothetical protein B0T24DRAFT_644199 [Lasiosphaeria ovina]
MVVFSIDGHSSATMNSQYRNLTPTPPPRGGYSFAEGETEWTLPAPSEMTSLHSQQPSTSLPPSPNPARPGAVASLFAIPKSILRWVDRQIDDTWSLELLALALSISSLIAIAAVLGAYNGHAIPNIPGGITLNTIVSILSAAAKSSLLHFVAASVGQAKWDRFDRRQQLGRLGNFETLDEASKGPLGSTKMLLFGGRGAWSSLATLGAVVTVLALAVEPFVQQVVGYADRTVTVSDAASSADTAWADRLRAPYILEAGGEDPLYTAYINAITGAIWNKASAYPRPSVHCPTGDCTFPPYQTLEWCAEAEVLSDPGAAATVDCSIAFNKTDFADIYNDFAQTGSRRNATRDCTIRFVDGRSPPLVSKIQFSLEGGNGPLVTNPAGKEPDYKTIFPTMIVSSLYQAANDNILANNGTTILGVRSPVLAMSYARFDTDNTSSPEVPPQHMTLVHLERAVLSPCIAQRTAGVTRGQPRTDVQARAYGTTGVSYNKTAADPNNMFCWSPDHDSNSSNIPPFCTQLLQTWPRDISDRLTGRFTTETLFNANGQSVNWRWHPSIDVKSPSSEDVLRQIQSRGLGETAHVIAASLNNLAYENGDISDRVLGSYMVNEKIIEVRWAWLALPFALEVIGVALLLVVMLRTRTAAGLWKGSILPALYAKLETHGQGYTGEEVSEKQDAFKVVRVSELKREAKAAQRRLKTPDGGERVVFSVQ